jgi:hypothetical protein
MKIMNIMKRAKEKSFQDAGPLRYFSSPAMSNRQTSSNIVKPSTLGGSFSACLDAGQRLRATQNDAETTPQRRNATCAACAWTLDSAVSAAFISWHTKSKPVSHGKQM